MKNDLPNYSSVNIFHFYNVTGIKNTLYLLFEMFWNMSSFPPFPGLPRLHLVLKQGMEDF